MLNLPALEPIRHLLHVAERGLHVLGPTRTKVRRLIKRMARTRGPDRVVQFLQILTCLATSHDCHPIASADFAANRHPYDGEWMNRVFQAITSRLEQELRLSDMAKLVRLSEGAFSRFFHAHAGKTFPEFVNELRVGRTCRLLTESERTVTEVAFRCGFSNLSNFNRQFYRLKGPLPSRLP